MTMSISLDPNMFTQIGLDSGSLTIFGTVVHNFPEPGDYRGVLHRGTEIEAVFYIKVDKESAAAHVNIDLATLTEVSDDKCECSSGHHESGRHFVVNPKGHVVFHVSKGTGGYYVHVLKVEDEPKQKSFDSRELKEGDIFAAIIIRPGTYSVTNLLTKARGEAVVTHPKTRKLVYPPPHPIRVDCTREAIEPKRIELHPGQGLIYQPKTTSRIKIELVKADDGPAHAKQPFRDGWRKPVLPKG